jgi:peroxiredoxin Q/BCP
VHADQTLWFLENYNVPHSSPHIRGKHSHAHQPSEGTGELIGDGFTAPETADEPSMVRPPTLTAGRIDSGVELPLEAPVEALSTTTKPPQWARNDVRGQILTWCVHSTSVAEIAARLSLPLGATRFLVDDLVTQGYLIERTLHGLRAL